MSLHKLHDIGRYSTTNFTKLLTIKWDELHDNSDILRYKIDKLEGKLVDGKYFLQLNPDRRSKRRTPEDINSISQPFDKNKFNFTKVSSKEILFSIESDDSDIHTVLVNVSPVSRYHSLLCPSVNQCLPQVVTLDSLQLAVQILFLTEDRDVRLGFNSMCGFASVNHLHYHIFVEKSTLFVETVRWEHLKGDIYRLDKTYPAPAFCFEILQHSSTQKLKVIFKLLEYFLKKSIAHNIILTRRKMGGGDGVSVIIWPRKGSSGAKHLVAFNVAMLELSGWFPIYDATEFESLQADDLEKELLKWNINDFDKLCEEVISL